MDGKYDKGLWQLNFLRLHYTWDKAKNFHIDEWTIPYKLTFCVPQRVPSFFPKVSKTIFVENRNVINTRSLFIPYRNKVSYANVNSWDFQLDQLMLSRVSTYNHESHKHDINKNENISALGFRKTWIKVDRHMAKSNDCDCRFIKLLS